MSYDDYVKYIAQKYKLAVTLAVIKTKPENVTIENHIRHLRNKVTKDMADSEDFNISICSDDFDLDENGDVIINIPGGDESDILNNGNNNGYVTEMNASKCNTDYNMPHNITHEPSKAVSQNDNVIVDKKNSRKSKTDAKKSNNPTYQAFKVISHNNDGNITEITTGKSRTETKKRNSTCYRTSKAVLHNNDVTMTDIRTCKTHANIRNNINGQESTVIPHKDDVIVIEMNPRKFKSENKEHNKITEPPFKAVLHNNKITTKANKNKCSRDTNKQNNTTNQEFIGITDNQNDIEMNETQDYQLNDTQDLNDSVTTLQNFEDDKTNLIARKDNNKFGEVMQLLKGIDDNLTTIDKAVSKEQAITTRTEDHTLQPSQPNLTQCSIDNDTICDGLDNLPEVNISCLSQDSNYGNETSQPNSYCKRIRIDNNKDSNNSTETTEIDRKTISNSIKLKTNTIEKPSKTTTNTNIRDAISKPDFNPKNTIKNTKVFKNIYKNVAGLFKTNQNGEDNIQNTATAFTKPDQRKLDKNISEQVHETPNELTMSSIPQELTYTHYSDSQTNNIVIDRKYIYGTKINQNLIHGDAKLPISRHEPYIEITIENDVVNQEPINKNSNKTNTNDKNACFTEINYADANDESNNINILNTNKVETKTDGLNQIPTKMIYKDSMYSESQMQNMRCDNTSLENIQNEKENALQNDALITKNKVIYMDNDLFTQESEIIQITNENMIEDDLPFNKDSLNVNFGDTAKSQNAFVIYEPIEMSQSYDTFDNNLRQVKRKTEFSQFNDSDIQILDTTEKQNIVKTNQDIGKFDKNAKNIVDLYNHQTRSTIIDDSNKQDTEKAQLLDNMRVIKEIDNKKRSVNFKNNTMKITLNSTLNTPSKFTKENKANIENNDLNQNENEFRDTEDCTNFDDVEKDLIELREVVPFKVIEELNKVKMYINRRADRSLSLGYSSDTGYRSDSSRTSFISSQTTNIVLNQSTHCLFNYITECPLVTTTEDITNEVSKVLGQLIDKLHEEENYPPFLEDLLNCVQSLLSTLYEETQDENSLFKKDEIIQRILLFNKSTHIQNYTLDKITLVLENLHSELNKNQTYEIKSIFQIENSCYIFHLLEILLEKYKKTDVSSQNLSQNSQSDRTLKKSNIVDIWRRKWNPNFKETSNEGSSQKQCVLTTCSAVLNKLVVDCMAGYSLISFYALKCFNIMQT